MDGELGVIGCKRLLLEGISKEILLCSTENVVESLMMEHDNGTKTNYTCMGNWVTMLDSGKKLSQGNNNQKTPNKHPTRGSHQTTRAENKGGREKTNKTQSDTANNMAIRTYRSRSTFNGNAQNAPTERHPLAACIQKEDASPSLCVYIESSVSFSISISISISIQIDRGIDR